ncbi:MAG: GWxTD domain-containing protein [Candidatus Latescibacteria bacterium]|nr:GWxTD domain-containing protein [Candidatus Latescibacterota bacterium]
MTWIIALSLTIVASGSAAPVDSLRVRAEADIEGGRPERAITGLKRVIDTGKETAQDYVLLGHAYLDAGNQKAARKAFRTAVKKGARAAGNNGLGLAYITSKQGFRRAETYFRRALRANPDMAEAQYHLAGVYLETRKRRAREAFERVIDIDAGYPDAHYQVGLLLEDDGKRHEAISAYQQEMKVNPAHPHAGIRMARLWLSLGRSEEAVDTLAGLLKSGGDARIPANRDLAVIALMNRDFERANKLFGVYFSFLPEAEQRRYQDISLVADDEDLARFEAASPEERDALAARFWNRRDPTPLTPENERLLEHYRRVAYALEHYDRPEGGWDKRGEVFIRLGNPDHISRWDDIQAERNRELQETRVNFVNRSRMALPISPGLPIFPVAANAKWEYWIYTQVEGGIEITFSENFKGRRYDFAPFPLRVAPHVGIQLAGFQGGVVMQNVVASRPSRYTPDFADLPIDFYYYPADFKGPESRTRLEVYYGLPASEVVRLNVDEKTDLILLDRGVALFDSHWNEVYREVDQMAFRAPTDQQISDGAFIPGVMPVDLPPGTYQMALQVRDVVSGKSQVYQQAVVLEDYHKPSELLISDIELAFATEPTEEPAGEYVKNGLKVIPMSSLAFRSHQNAFVYFEIYNLKQDAFGQTRYRVEYTLRSQRDRALPAKILHGLGRVFRLSEKDREIVIAYDQAGNRPDEVAYVELDLTETQEGGQLVRVAVTDLQVDEMVSKEISFSIVP